MIVQVKTYTYMVMRGSAMLGYLDAYSLLHAVIKAERLYGCGVEVELVYAR